MQNKNKRLTIGLLVSGITEHFVISICKGVMHAAKAADVDLVVLPGKYIDRDLSENAEIRYEYQYNTLFEYADSKTLDAVIVAADVIGCFTSKDKIGELLGRYKNMPCVLIASKFPGFVSITSDNSVGIREAMEYLIENKHCERFGMIGGPEENTDAKERKDAFMQVLSEHDLPFTENSFVISDLSKRDKKAACTLLDKNPDVEAVFCINDDVAINLYEEMNKRSLVPGKDIYVFGYDNSTLSSKVSPTLSSIWTNTNELGEKALQTLIKLVNKESVKSQKLPVKFIMRESFGDKKADLNTQHENYTSLINTYVDSVFYNCRYEESKDAADSTQKFELLLQKLFSLSNPENDSDYTQIIKCADQIHMKHADIDNLLGIYEEIFSYICRKNPEKTYELRKLFDTLYRKMIRSMNNQFGQIQAKQESDNYLFKLFVSNTMQFENGTDQSYTKLFSDIDFLGIKNAHLYLFEKAITHFERDSFIRPDTLLLKAVLENGTVKAVPSISQKLNIDDIFHFEKTCNARFCSVCLPLFSNETLYGLILCDLSPQLFENGEFLANQLGAAVKMIDLLKTNEKIQQKLKESLSVLHANNIKLDNLSKSDTLTGILNRRGFYKAAEELISDLKEKNKKLLFAYVDMNNLKIVNDRYGHDEGDFSLKLIGEILTDAVDGLGITGRIGGDEYACVLDYSKSNDEKEFVKTINDSFAKFNETSDKTYNITVSVGTYVTASDSGMSLHDALSHADESLYEAKKHRSKNIEKNPIS